MRHRPHPATVIALLALLVALSGTAVADPVVTAAKKLFTGRDIKDGSIGVKDLSKSARTKLKGSTGVPGEHGAQGDRGAQGERGLPGEQGLQGQKGDKGDDGSDASINGVAAGGDLQGFYPNPTLAPAVVVPDSFSTSAFPTIRAINTGNQVVANNTFQFVRLQAHDHLRAINHDEGTTNAADCSVPDFGAPGDCFVKVTQPGTYLVTGSVTWASNANGIRILDINGWTSNLGSSFALGRDERKPVASSTLNPNPTTTQTLSTVHQLTTGQSVSMRAYQDSGADLAVFGATDDSTRAALTVTWLSPGA